MPDDYISPSQKNKNEFERVKAEIREALTNSDLIYEDAVLAIEDVMASVKDAAQVAKIKDIISSAKTVMKNMPEAK